MRTETMVKQKAVVLLLALAALTGCGSTASTETAGTEAKVKETLAETESAAAESIAAESTAQAEQESASEAEQESASEETAGYYLTYEGINLCVDADMADVLEALGEADSYFEATSCAFEGLDKIYTYGSIEIDTYPSGDQDLISTIAFRDDLVETNEGAAIGNTQEEVEAIYGEGTEENGTLVYEKDGMKLYFVLEDGKAVSIEYRSEVLD